MLRVASRVSRPTFQVAKRALQSTSARDEVKTLLFELERCKDTQLIIQQAIDTKLHRRFCDEEIAAIDAFKKIDDVLKRDAKLTTILAVTTLISAGVGIAGGSYAIYILNK